MGQEEVEGIGDWGGGHFGFLQSVRPRSTTDTQNQPHNTWIPFKTIGHSINFINSRGWLQFQQLYRWLTLWDGLDDGICCWLDVGFWSWILLLILL